MAFAQAAARPIPGAVATIGVSDRVVFLRRTYGLLGVALTAFAMITAGMMRFAPETSFRWSQWAFSGRWNWLIVMGLFMVVGTIAEKLAMSQTSRAVQLGGLAIFVVAEAFLLQPLLWVCIFKFGPNTSQNIIVQSALVTLAIFVGLTATVFVTKKDFTFLRGILSIGAFAMLGIIVASMLFGFSLGMLFIGFAIALMAGYILFQTSLIMSQFPPSAWVAAALMLFSTVATLFWYVLQLFMRMNSRR